jgi:predicted anti-sigma-YlaC factor YlaD
MTRRRFRLLKTEHDYVHDRLSAYVDGELSPRERSRVKAHLRTCALCQTELRELRWTKSVLQQAPAVELPRSFVLRQVDVAPYRSRRRGLGSGTGWAMQWATVAVALMFVLVLAGDLLSTRFLLGAPAPSGAETVIERAEVKVEVEQEVVVEEQPLAAAPAPEEGRTELAPTPSPGPPMASKALKEEETQAQAADIVTKTMKAAPVGAEQGSLEVTSTVTSTEPAGERMAFVAPTEDEEAQEHMEDQEVQLTPRGGGGLAPQEERVPRSQTWSLTLAVQRGWRIAEVVLGLALVGLVIATIWARTRS